jgi:hypothetical protein
MSQDFDSKRPDHPDFMDHSELKKAGFSGLRSNTLSSELEIWVDGEIRRRITSVALAEHGDGLIAIAMEDIFGLHDVAISGTLQ